MEDEGCRDLKTLIEKKGDENGSRSFLLYEDRVISYQEMNENSNRISRSLRKLGIRKGDKVLVFFPNCLEYILLWFALAKLGAVMVPINTGLKRDDLTYIIQDSDAKAIVLESGLLEVYGEVRKRAGLDLEIILPKGPSNPPGDMVPFATLLEESADRLEGDVQMSDPVNIMYTSGSTGKPKGVILPHFNYLVSGKEMACYCRLQPGDRMFTPLPLFHIGAQQVVVIPSLLAGIDFALGGRFSASKFWDQVRQYRCSVVHCIYPMTMFLYKQEAKADDADHPARRMIGGGSRFSKEDLEKFEKRFRITCLPFYALTEAGCPTTYFSREKPEVGNIGRPVSHLRVEILNDDDEIVPPYTRGTIAIRPEKPYSMMLGYYKKPEATLEAWRNLWFHTGDIAYKDEEGYIYFVGRKSYFIRRRGENISAEEVEGVLNSYPGVENCAVVGVPGEMGDDEVKAYVVAKEGVTILPQDIWIWCQERIAHFKIPRYIEFVHELPVGAVDRVERYKLKERGIGNCWDREKAGHHLFPKENLKNPPE
jgi:crotonobetaine/carnitine-CoA ligase